MKRTPFSVLVLTGALLLAGLPVSAQLSFASQATYVAGSQPESTALGDFNRDGDLDAAVTSDAPDKVTIHSNNGTGTLAITQTVNLGNGTSPHFIVAADLDGDGDLDLGVTLKNVDAVTVLVNNGGTFTPSGVLMAVGSDPRSMVAVNIDGDADFDLVTSNRNSNTLSVLRNNGNATFQPAVSVPVGSSPRHVAAADVDLDGDADLVVANNVSNSISVLLNNGAGAFAVVASLSTATFDPEGIVAVNLDTDGDFDLAASAHDASTGQNVVLVFKNLGGATFGGFQSFPIVGQDPGFVVASDLDLDGDLDLATANRNTNDVSALANNGQGAFGAAIVLAVGTGPEHVTAGDLTGDQVPDLVATNDAGTTISVLRNLVVNGTLSMLAPAAIGTVAPMQVSSPSDAGDFYVTAFAFGAAPGLTLPDGRHLPLNDDLLLAVSLFPNNGFFLNIAGFLGAGGTAIVSIAIPAIPELVGASIYGCGVLLNGTATAGVEQILGPLTITFQ